MHLLLAQKGAIQQGDEAVDLGQAPAELIFLSAADTELTAIGAARAKLAGEGDAPVLRLANWMRLVHPMSVDVYCEKTVRGSRLVVARILGGESYWPYGLEMLRDTCLRHGVKLAVLPGDANRDPALERLSTLDAESLAALHGYLQEGGPDNARNFLFYCRDILDGGLRAASPRPLLKAGIWTPEAGICDLAAAMAHFDPGMPVAAVCFYRALVQAGALEPVEALGRALRAEGLNPLPLFVSSLKDPVSAATLRSIFADCPPAVVVNLTGFAVGSPGAANGGTPLDEPGAVVLQGVLAATSREEWRQSSQGLTARDLAMHVALPEVDGRVLARAIAFKEADRHDEAAQATIARHVADPEATAFTARLAANWARLSRLENRDKRIALVLANYPNRDGRIANGVGLDTPAGAIEALRAMDGAGYETGALPSDGDALVRHLQEGPTNAARDGRVVRERLSLARYKAFHDALPADLREALQARWGEPQDDPFFDAQHGGFAISVSRFGKVAVGVQPARGYNIDPKETYHSPDLVPPHGYLAFHAWLRMEFGAHAVVHMGKHGNLEWLPGKALSLSASCWPQAALGPMPHLYPFIVNDPGEGSQAKRRTSAVIVDHLTPPLTRAESHGPMRELEALVDEYYEASGGDRRRLPVLRRQIFERVADAGLEEDLGLASGMAEEDRLQRLDAWLCDLKEMQIRDGLHIFGQSPQGRLLHDLATAISRLPRGTGEDGEASLMRAIAADALGDGELDPLDCEFAAPWRGRRPDELAEVSADPWRSHGDCVERIELLAAQLVAGERDCPAGWERTRAVLQDVHGHILPSLEACGPAEISGLLAGLCGRFVPPGPSGAPTRGRPDALPTGRNFHSVDSRAVPTPAAWELGRKSAELLIARYRQDHGEWPQSFGLSAWGTSNMRTGGDDIAQAMALIGAKPVWEDSSRRVTGYKIITIAELGRPRVDVTLRISGFFRDAFPAQIELFDRAVRAVGALEEEDGDNPVAKRMRAERAALIAGGADHEDATRRAGYRIFGSKPGAYGAGLQALIDERGWERRDDLAQAYLAWGSYAYGAQEDGRAERDAFAGRLAGIDAVIHNQDNREHDLLDSDDYYQFEGGMSAAAELLSGKRPAIYHNDHSRPERPVVRALEEEIARVVRGRAANPKWIAGVMRHGYKGAFEMAATLDYMFAFAATTGAVRSRHFDIVHDAWIADEAVRAFIAEANPHALREMAQRFLEAEERGLWTPRSNSARFALAELAGGGNRP
jgi:cobaltochelatase CobN